MPVVDQWRGYILPPFYCSVKAQDLLFPRAKGFKVAFLLTSFITQALWNYLSGTHTDAIGNYNQPVFLA